MPSINFMQVAADEKIPGYYGEITTTKANQGVFDWPAKILVIGQMTDSGTAAALSKNIIADVKQAKELFGRGSQIALMCEAVLAVQDTVEVHAIPQEDDGASATAAGSVTVTSAATVSGTLFLYIAGTRLQVGVKSTNTTAQIATAIAAAINAEIDLPVTASIAGASPTKVDITAKNAGLCGNQVNVTTNYNTGEQFPAGLALTIVQLNGGTANPDIGDVLDVIEGDWYTDIAMPYTDTANLAALEDALKERFSATDKKDAHAQICVRGTFSENYTFANGRNSAHISCMDMPADALEPSYVWAAMLAGWAGFWSNQHPARPYKGLVLKGIKPPKTRRTRTERRVLLSNGCSTWDVNASGEVVIERLVTMYQVNEGGIDDETWLDITTPKTFSRIRYDANAYVSTLYFGAEGKVLTENEAAAAISDILVTPKTIAASLTGRSQLWVEEGWVSELIEMRAEIDSGDPTRVNVLTVLDITNPLMILANKLDMRL